MVRLAEEHRGGADAGAHARPDGLADHAWARRWLSLRTGLRARYRQVICAGGVCSFSRMVHPAPYSSFCILTRHHAFTVPAVHGLNGCRVITRAQHALLQFVANAVCHMSGCKM